MTIAHAPQARSGERYADIASVAGSVSLQLLRAIDGTVNALMGISSVADGLARIMNDMGTEIRALDVIEGDYLDPDDKTISSLESSANNLKDYLTILVRKRAAIDRDSRLCDHHCDALHDAYETASASVAELIDAIQFARAAIISHDLACEPRGGPEVYDTVDALILSLRGE